MFKAMVLSVILIYLLYGPSLAMGTEPKDIPSMVDIHMPQKWYQDQVEAWNGVVKSDPGNAKAWYNLFRARRYVGFQGGIFRDPQVDELTAILARMKEAIPGTFEYNLCMWIAGGNDGTRFTYLQKAFELRKDYVVLSNHFVPHYELAMDRAKRDEFLKQWYETGDISPVLLDHAYNMLQSCSPNAVLITAGDSDTFPVWMLQAVMGVRMDVTVMNLGLIAADGYRSSFMSQHVIGGDSLLLKGRNDSEEAMQGFVESVAMRTVNRPIHFALTVDTSVYEKIKSDLHIVGLSWQYSKERIDHLARTARIWNAFRLDDTMQPWYPGLHPFYAGSYRQLIQNYLAPCLALFEHAIVGGDAGQAERFRTIATRFGTICGNLNEVESYLRDVQKRAQQ